VRCTKRNEMNDGSVEARRGGRARGSNPHYPQQLVSRYITAPHVATLFDHLNHAVASFGPRPCLGTREWRGPPHAAGPYRWMTFQQLGIARTEVASGLLGYGIRCVVRPATHNPRCL
jgi:hypothetical protein